LNVSISYIKIPNSCTTKSARSYLLSYKPQLLFRLSSPVFCVVVNIILVIKLTNRWKRTCVGIGNIDNGCEGS